jgi:CelD/BcsL family acetyltransferase involved in cellulose biosynthesis
MIEELDVEDPEWKRFVDAERSATPFHHPSWTRVITDAYGFRSCVVAWRGRCGDIAAGMPTVYVGIPRRTRCVLPFTDECGPLGAPVAIDALMRDLSRQTGVTWEIRGDVPHFPRARVVGVTHRLDLAPGPEALFRRFHRSQVQRAIRKGERERTVTVRRSQAREDTESVYYDLHLRTRRRQGLPPQPRRFFRAIWERMHNAGLAATYVAYIGQTPVAGAVFLRWQGTLVYKYGASLPSAWAARPNHLIFWEAIKDGCRTGCHALEFGRSDLHHTGLRAFKSQWGATERPLRYKYSPAATEGLSRRGSGVVPHVSRAVFAHAPLWVCEKLGSAVYRFAA